jgi:acyl-CoA thioesterase
VKEGDVARQSAEALWANDDASRGLGMQLVDVGAGRAAITMTVRPDMVNGHGCCHGGLVATLADSAFAFACNSHGIAAVAAGFDITFVAPAVLGDVLLATATERVRHGRSGLYDVTVTRADGSVIAEFRGRSRSTGRPIDGVTSGT